MRRGPRTYAGGRRRSSSRNATRSHCEAQARVALPSVRRQLHCRLPASARSCPDTTKGRWHRPNESATAACSEGEPDRFEGVEDEAVQRHGEHVRAIGCPCRGARLGVRQQGLRAGARAAVRLLRRPERPGDRRLRQRPRGHAGRRNHRFGQAQAGDPVRWHRPGDGRRGAHRLRGPSHDGGCDVQTHGP